MCFSNPLQYQEEVMESEETLCAKLEKVDALARFLMKHHQTDVLMLVNNKQPLHKHAGQGEWSWEHFRQFRNKHPSHTQYAILLKSLCVVDFDREDIIPDWEQRFPELLQAPSELTKRGRHYFFKRSKLADSGKYYDGARQMFKNNNEDKLEVDFKTITSTGTGGVLVVCPAGGREWVRPLYSHPLDFISDALLSAVAKPGGHSNRKQPPVGDTTVCLQKVARVDKRECFHEDEKDNMIGECSLTLLTLIINSLSTQRIASYSSWLLIVFAISNISHTNGYAEQGHELAHTMSKRAGRYEAAAVDAKFREAAAVNAESIGQKVGIGSVRAWAKEDNKSTPGGADVLKAIRLAAAHDRNSDGGAGSDREVLSREVYEMIMKSDPEKYADVNQSTFSATAEAEWTMRLRDSGNGMDFVMSYPNCSTTDNHLADQHHDNFIIAPMPVKHLGRFHHDLTYSVLEFSRHTRGGQDISQLRGTGASEGKLIIMYNFFSRKPTVQLVGLTGAVTARMVKILEEIVLPQVAAQFSKAMGSSAGQWFQQINVQTLNVFVAAGEGDRRQSDERLASALLAAAPELLYRIVFSPDAASGACNGLYYCDPSTNVWARTHNAQIHQLIKQKFTGVQGLSTADTSFVENVKGQETIRHVLAGKLADVTFADRLDANLDIFACSNGVFDCSDGTLLFRGTRPDDVVETTTGWAYDREAAKKYRAQLMLFLEQVLPFPEERRVVLTYIAHLMSGRRTAKKFLVLTDRRDGHNGKSSLAKMLLNFFGKLAMRNTQFVCKGSFDKDKSSHDAALGPTRGKRLLVADELKNTMTLDVAMFKDKAGGCTQVSGRAFGSSQQYNYVWQAGFLLIFNDSDCPKIDVADQAFIGRMIVAPMRSKFVDVVGEEPYTYLLDADLYKKFEFWRSSLADILMETEHQQLILLRNVPASMSEWRQDVAQGSNPVAEWLDTRVVATGNYTDILLLATLESWKGSFCAFCDEKSVYARLTTREFRKLAKAHLMGFPNVEFFIQAYIKGVKMNALFRGVTSNLELQSALTCGQEKNGVGQAQTPTSG